MEDSHFLGARRPQVFLQECSPLGVEVAAFPLDDLLRVRPGLGGGVDAGHLEALDLADDGVREMRGRVGRAQVDQDARLANSTAIAAATVVFPTPPLPITITSAC